MSGYVVAPTRLGETELPDGRQLGWAEWGPADGIPVLLSPGAATSRWLGLGGKAPEALEIRLVSVDRPGLGASTPNPGRTFSDFADDIRRFSSQQGWDRPAMVGNSQGTPFAFACAEAGVIGALAVVSGADEVAAPEFADTLPPELAGLLERVRADPDGARTLFEGFSADAMWDMVMAASPESDLAVYQEPGFAAAYRRALDEAFAQGTTGYATDTVLAMGRWSIDLSAIAVPVDLWYGEQDSSHSPDLGATLTSRMPGARRHIVPDIGGAVLWTHTASILRTLLERRVSVR